MSERTSATSVAVIEEPEDALVLRQPWRPSPQCVRRRREGALPPGEMEDCRQLSASPRRTDHVGHVFLS